MIFNNVVYFNINQNITFKQDKNWNATILLTVFFFQILYCILQLEQNFSLVDPQSKCLIATLSEVQREKYG